MPNSVQSATPGTVLPQSLCRAFAHSREYALLENEYRNGEWQRGLLVSTSRKRWRLGKRLTPALLQQLRDFYDARKGPHEPFYFYDPFEAIPKFSYDPTGTATQGRYTVRFEGAWEQSVGLARADVEISLVEVV
jgi:hypothetical protein